MTQRLANLGSFPFAPFRKVGTITLLVAKTFHHANLYPGADYWLDALPQTVDLECNGYYVRATFKGIISDRGYYGGPVGVEGTYRFSYYADEIDAFLGNPADHHKNSDIVERTQQAWGHQYVITLDED